MINNLLKSLIFLASLLLISSGCGGGGKTAPVTQKEASLPPPPPASVQVKGPGLAPQVEDVSIPDFPGEQQPSMTVGITFSVWDLRKRLSSLLPPRFWTFIENDLLSEPGCRAFWGPIIKGGGSCELYQTYSSQGKQRFMSYCWDQTGSAFAPLKRMFTHSSRWKGGTASEYRKFCNLFHSKVFAAFSPMGITMGEDWSLLQQTQTRGFEHLSTAPKQSLVNIVLNLPVLRREEPQHYDPDKSPIFRGWPNYLTFGLKHAKRLEVLVTRVDKFLDLSTSFRFPNDTLIPKLTRGFNAYRYYSSIAENAYLWAIMDLNDYWDSQFSPMFKKFRQAVLTKIRRGSDPFTIIVTQTLVDKFSRHIVPLIRMSGFAYASSDPLFLVAFRLRSGVTDTQALNQVKKMLTSISRHQLTRKMDKKTRMQMRRRLKSYTVKVRRLSDPRVKGLVMAVRKKGSVLNKLKLVTFVKDSMLYIFVTAGSPFSSIGSIVNATGLPVDLRAFSTSNYATLAAAGVDTNTMSTVLNMVKAFLPSYSGPAIKKTSSPSMMTVSMGYDDSDVLLDVLRIRMSKGFLELIEKQIP